MVSLHPVLLYCFILHKTNAGGRARKNKARRIALRVPLKPDNHEALHLLYIYI